MQTEWATQWVVGLLLNLKHGATMAEAFSQIPQMCYHRLITEEERDHVEAQGSHDTHHVDAQGSHDTHHVEVPDEPGKMPQTHQAVLLS